jgi:hypothetical protein
MRFRFGLRRLLAWVLILAALSAFLCWLRYDLRSLVASYVAFVALAVWDAWKSASKKGLRWSREISYYSLAIALSVATAFGIDYLIALTAAPTQPSEPGPLADVLGTFAHEFGKALIKVFWTFVAIAGCLLVSVIAFLAGALRRKRPPSEAIDQGGEST